jgi:WD40 repeat protein
VRLWRIPTGEPIGAAFTFGSQANTVDLSPDGRTLVAAGQGEVTMWDVATGSILGQSWFPGVGSQDDDNTLAAAFTSDGRKLFIVRETGEAWVWDVDPASWEQRACQIAGRSLTQAEWQLYLPDRPYHATCGP